MAWPASPREKAARWTAGPRRDGQQTKHFVHRVFSPAYLQHTGLIYEINAQASGLSMQEIVRTTVSYRYIHAVYQGVQTQ